jgi:alkanesulfonate monooxygenase SsuD/methylene tetrahydromethanopterin reductase-like flavin-dependent oxidoreductase (luciferase family)
MTVRAAAEAAGRDPALLRIVVRGVVQLGEERTKPLTGSADEIRADLARLADAGVTEVFLDLNFVPAVVGSADPAAALATAEEVLTTFAPAG